MRKEYLPDKEKRILLSALSHEMKLVKDNNLTELIPVVKNLDYKFMYDRLFKKIEDNAYQQGRADERNKVIDEFAEWLVSEGILGNRVVANGEITDYGKVYAKQFKEQMKGEKV